jgi:tetratricopeptide (TPR) repeat protein
MKYEIYSSKYFGVEPEPVNPKFIRMDKDMQKGYGHDYEGETGKAIFYWNVVFENLKSYFEEYKLESLKDFDKIFNGNQYVSNWVQDYDEALRKVLMHSDKISKQEIGRRKIDLLNFLLSLNLSEETTIHNHKRSLAETYYLMGQPEVGEKHFIQLIEEYPDNAWGYIGYSDQYWLEKDNKNYKKALKILNKAYNRRTVDDSNDIVERLTGLHIAIKEKELEEYLEKEKEDILHEDITIIEAIDHLRRDSDDIPFSYLKFLESNREDVEPLILEEMKAYIKDPDNYAKSNGLLSVYLPFMFGQWERKESSKDIIELVACSEESIDRRIGYTITEEYPVVLYKCFDGDLDYLKGAINRDNVGSFPKLAYLRALSMYYVEDLKDIEGLKVYLEKLLKEQPDLATWISSIVLMHHLDELLVVGEKSVKSKFYYPGVNGQWSEFKFHFYSGFIDETTKYKEPFNAIEAFRSWSSFSDERPIIPDYATLYKKLLNIREEKLRKSEVKVNTNQGFYQKTLVKGKKIGRNEPCPCGSGKKYKKCCGK